MDWLKYRKGKFEDCCSFCWDYKHHSIFSLWGAQFHISFWLASLQCLIVNKKQEIPGTVFSCKNSRVWLPTTALCASGKRVETKCFLSACPYKLPCLFSDCIIAQKLNIDFEISIVRMVVYKQNGFVRYLCHPWKIKCCEETH